MTTCFRCFAAGIMGLIASAGFGIPLSAPVGVYEAHRFEGRCTVDGKLDEPGWRTLTFDRRFAAFGRAGSGPAPAPPPIETAFACGFNDAGLFLGIRCSEPAMDRIRATITQADDGNLWTDDCVEIYFSSLPRRVIAFRKFIVNALGTRYDGIQNADGSLDPTWTDASWHSAVQRSSDGWTIEVFFAWGSLGFETRPEGVALGLCRFSWSGGKFRGASWGPGMGYPFIWRAGAVYLGAGFVDRIRAAAAELNRLRGPFWRIETDTGIIEYRDKTAALRALWEDVRRKEADVQFLVSLVRDAAFRVGIEKQMAALPPLPSPPGPARAIDGVDSTGAFAAARARMAQFNALENQVRIRLLLEHTDGVR
ncbi:MAG: hypothetical protein GXP31_07760 [Kiritimatiellaeota bacterium]|nr:hypothetical protein [Kiritimatiellota bacterium]